MARAVGEVLAKAIEIVDSHPLEEPREHALFSLSIIIEPQLHQHQQRGMEQEAQYETGCATGKADKLDQSVVTVYRSFGEGMRSMICLTAQERPMATTK